HATTTRYDLTGCLDHTYPEQVQNTLGHTTLAQYDCATGLTSLVRTPSGQDIVRLYDALGRVVGVSLPGDSAGDSSKRFDYLNVGDPGGQTIRTTRKDGSGDGLWAEETYDGLGRKVTARAEGDQGIVYTRFDYDALGRLTFGSVPTYGGLGGL